MNALAIDAMTPLPPPTQPPTLPELPRPPRFERSIGLAALPTALLCTRLFVASTLRRWGARFLEADVELLAVELVRHAVESCGVIDDDVRLADLEDVSVIQLRLLGFEQTIGIEVWDNATEPARLPAHVPEGELRGFGLVEARATDWGWYLVPSGRVVWAELEVYERPVARLPRRKPSPLPKPLQPKVFMADLELLQRVRSGLDRL